MKFFVRPRKVIVPSVTTTTVEADPPEVLAPAPAHTQQLLESLRSTVAPAPVPVTAPAMTRQTTPARVRGSSMALTTVDALMARLDAVKSRNLDVQLKWRDLSFKDNGTVYLKGDGRHVFTWSDHAFSQMCAKLKIPSEFLRRCPTGEGPATQKAIFEYWKEHMDERDLLLRARLTDTPDEETGALGFIRAVLTDKYAMFDNLDLVKLIAPHVEKHEMKVMTGSVTEKSFHLRLLFPEEIEMSIEGKSDPHNVGLHLRNSEVGACNTQGDYLLFRQVCSNGLIALWEKEHLFYQRHMGVMAHQVRAAIQASFDTVLDRKGAIIDRLLSVAEEKVADPLRELRRILKNYGATQEAIERVEQSYDREPIPSRYGMIQAITRAAQGMHEDTRVSLEEFAGSLM